MGGPVLFREALLSRGEEGNGDQELLGYEAERPEAVSTGRVNPGGPSQPVRLTVPAALAGERVDRALALLAGVSRAQASRLVAEGRVRVGGASLGTGGRRLRPGELLEVEAGTDETPGAPLQGQGDFAAGPTPEAGVVFVDKDLVVVDKPAGLVVHPGAGNREGTLVQQLVRLFPDIAEAGPAGDRPGIVQRLDKGTSGLLVVARTPAAREGLVAQLSARTVERRYLAIVHGELQADEGLVEAPLGRSPAQRLKMAVVEGGREARTRYSTIDRSSSPPPREPGVLPPRDRAHPSGARSLRRHWAPGIRRRTLFEAQAVGRGANSSAGARQTVVARVGPRFRPPDHRRAGPLHLEATG